jgi:hypothetical protein
MSVHALLIDGWDHQSTWGFDDEIGSLYAHLTRNCDSVDDGPNVWLTPPAMPKMLELAMLAQAITHITSAHPAAVHTALNNSLDDTNQPPVPSAPGC